MEGGYAKCVAGLSNEDPAIVLESAVWLIENPEQVEDPGIYGNACELLIAASMENIECLRYINGSIQKQLGFKAQLLSQLFQQGTGEVKEESKSFLLQLIQDAMPLKTTNTDMAAEVYSSLKESGIPEIIEKAKQLIS